jgi:hypothetical protein
MAMLTPKYKASHNFGFMSMINRLAGFLGPFIFSTLSFMYDAKTAFIGSLSLSLSPPPPPPPHPHLVVRFLSTSLVPTPAVPGPHALRA